MTRQHVALTGDTGFLGKNLTNLFEELQIEVAKSGGQGQYDFTSYADCEAFISRTKPKVLIHLAALSGGIGANRDRPDEFFHVNTLLVANMFRAAALNGVKEIIYTFGGCSYPNSAKSPISEESLWEGIPHGDSSAYSLAKKMGVVAAKAYRTYGLKSKLLIPGNLYGQFDNYSLENSHVIPAMIRKFHEAKIAGADLVTMWGDGTPTRDFVYVSDVAAAIVKIIEIETSEDPINLSSGVSISIRHLAETIAELIGYQGDVFWDASKPNGQQDKIFSVKKAQSLGLSMNTDLITGLKTTIDWFQSNYEVPGAIRL
jgi:GDP-L-fucose synthase